jgi:hypothetical protein
VAWFGDCPALPLEVFGIIKVTSKKRKCKENAQCNEIRAVSVEVRREENQKGREDVM